MTRFFLLIGALFLFSSSRLGQLNKTKHHIFEVSNKEEDFTPKVFEALHNNKELECTIEFKTGIDNFYPEKAYEKYVKISNNDNGVRKFIFALEGRNNITINGNGSTFIFH